MISECTLCQSLLHVILTAKRENIARVFVCECVCAHIDQEFCGISGWGIFITVTLPASEEVQAYSQNTASAAAALGL